jgi:acyl carrier protein
MTTLQSVQALLRAQFELAPEVVPPEATLADLDIDSLSMIEVMFDLEDKFDVKFPSGRATLQAGIKTVGDLAAYVDRLIAEKHPEAAAQEAAS